MNRLQVSAAKLDELVRIARHFNKFPIEFPSIFYSNKPARLATILRDLVTDVAELIEALNDTEFDALISSFPGGYKMFVDGASRGALEDRQRLALYYLGAEVHKRYFSLADAVDADLQHSVVLQQYPELRTLLDDDGLLKLDERFTLHDGGIEYRDHVIHYHQFLRRGYTSNPNFEFLSRFIRFHEETRSSNAFRVGIDHRRLMPLEAFHLMMECDVWRGPTFAAEQLDDPNAVGVTVVKRIEYPPFKLHYDLDRTEFMWSFRDGVKTFEVEEVSNVTAKFGYLYLNRYLHSERLVAEKRFRHLDGAVKVYLENEYAGRVTSSVPNEPRAFRRVKVWRVDGEIPLPRWLDLIGFFFKGNEMLIEYFDPERFHAELIERERARQEWLARQHQ
ncbi:MAG TPA: hypothetical protein VK648_05695 [Gemmatimonadaceae bacterium]|nr:MAG: hypothetical protein DMF56_20705 [Acidobacteriota bacterium]HTD83269.1 hypothetical protein [Gemmatimonadaceae bacterium]